MDGNDTLSDDGSPTSGTFTTIVFGTLLYLVVILTIFGNVLVLMAVYVEKKLRTTFNYYIVNLAITDVAVAVTAMSFYTTSYVVGYWPFGNVMCAVWIFFDYGMTFVSVFTLVLISVDRFWSVTWYVHYRNHSNKKRTLLSIGGVWIFMLVFWLPPCIMDRLKNSSNHGECKWEPALNRAFVIIIAIVGHHGSCLVMIFCYIRVLSAMRKRKKVGIGEHNQLERINSVSEHIAEAPSQSTGVGGMSNASTSSPLLSPQILQMEPSSTNQYCRNESHGHLLCACVQSINVRRRNDQSQRGRHKRDKRVFITLTYIIVAYMICWVPFHFVFDVSSIDPNIVPEVVFEFTFFFTYINSTINPVLYACSCAEFRDVFVRILSRKGNLGRHMQ